MGWWGTNEAGQVILPVADSEMVWGDEPADKFDEALDLIDRAFLREVGRKPTMAEVKAGLLFSASTRGYEC